MKNCKTIILPILLLISLSPTSIKAINVAEPAPVTSSMPNAVEQTKLYENRILEIKAMDKSKLNSAEKKQLKKELRTMKKAISNQGVYLSVGTILVVILLLVLLL